MQDEAQPAAEPDLAPVMCARCGAELAEEESWPEFCPNCQQPLDLPTQFAYSRGRDAFIAGQEILIAISPKKRRKNLTTEQEMQGLQYYTQAYSSLQQAFMAELAESQRRLGIEMMAAMAQLFQQHGIVSHLEAAYWTTLMIELTTHLEQERLRARLTPPPKGFFAFFLRWRWQMRKDQLEQALVGLEQKIKTLERHIAFVDKPRVRRKLSH